MYRIDDAVKRDPDRRWALRDRVFFACGACHILAWTVLDRHAGQGFQAVWIRPAAGFTGNHIVAVREGRAFDYHGWADWAALLAHTTAKARRWWPGWSATLVPLPAEVLVSEAKSLTWPGLWLREPGQFLHDPLPRARAFLARHDAPQ